MVESEDGNAYTWKCVLCDKEVNGDNDKPFGNVAWTWQELCPGWKKLKQLDSAIEVSDTILSDYLLLCSRLDRNQRLMIKTARAGDKSSDTVAKFLRSHHPTIHLEETGRRIYKNRYYADEFRS